MNRTRILSAAFLILTAASALLPASDLRTWSSSSPEYRMAYALALSAGENPPSPVSPVTTAELTSFLSWLDTSKLSAEEKEAMDFLLAHLEWEPQVEVSKFKGDGGIIISPEIYAQTSAIEPVPGGSSDMVPNEYPWKIRDRLPSLAFQAEGEWAGTVHAQLSNDMLASGRAPLHDKIFATNLDGYFDGMAMEQDGTTRAGITIGASWGDFSIARDRQSFGYGRTGNIGLSDNFHRQDWMRARLNSSVFDYTFSLTQYDTMGSTTSEGQVPSLEEMSVSGRKQVLAVHRFELKAGPAQFTFQEMGMGYFDNVFDLRLLNPILYLHGFSNNADGLVWNGGGDEMNNMVVVEAGWTIIPHLRANFQFGIDQITLPGEVRGDENTRPNAYAALLNLEGAWARGGRYFEVWAEGTWASPYFYLNRKADSDGSFMNNLDFLVGNKNWRNSEISYTGLAHGPDCVSLSAGFGWGAPGLFSLDGRVTWSVHGKYGYGYQSVQAEMGPDHVDDLWISLPFEKCEHKMEVVVDASWSPADWVDFTGGVGFAQIWNQRTIEGETYTGLQLRLGVALDPIGASF